MPGGNAKGLISFACLELEWSDGMVLKCSLCFEKWVVALIFLKQRDSRLFGRPSICRLFLQQDTGTVRAGFTCRLCFGI
jgi:hypothetical protein